MIKVKVFKYKVKDVGYGMYQHLAASEQLNDFIKDNNIKDDQIQDIQFSGNNIMLIYKEVG